MGGSTLSINRRDALRLGALGAVGAAGLTIPFASSVSTSSVSTLSDADFPVPFQAAFRHQQVLEPYKRGVNPQTGKPVDFYSVVEQPVLASILPGGRKTAVYAYAGFNRSTRQWIGGLPALRLDTERGREVMLRVRNKLPARNHLVQLTLPNGQPAPFHTSTHLHGSASKPQFDGYASDLTLPGQHKDYWYPNVQDARTLWFHDHGVHITAQNAYSGLAAQYHMHDAAERALLPQGEFDIPLTLSDAIFNADGSVGYDDRGHSGLMGDVILVNGVPWPNLKVKRRVYRFRLLVGGISRSYRLRLSNGAPVHMVATDGGLMPKTQAVGTWRHISAERYEFLIDFTKYKPGTKIQLQNLSNPNNVDYDHTNKVMQFEVTDEPFTKKNNVIPSTLVNTPAMNLRESDYPNVDRSTLLEVERKNGQWTVNGMSWDPFITEGVAVDNLPAVPPFKRIVANPDFNEVQVWTLSNPHGGWYHPLHVHLIDFQVLRRRVNGGAWTPPFAWERGPKDTVYLGENEEVQIISKFEIQKGYYMVHCHNLPHEDHDMMVQYKVGKGTDDNSIDPIGSAPAKADNLPADDSDAYLST
jgi:FtsP/CotA-like multicopper oxidase with cupredoxin domain